MENYEGKVFYTNEELAEILKRTKNFLDKTYLDIKMSRYGKKQADRAMLEFFTNCDFGCFPTEETRKKFEEFTYHGNEIYQILLDFAISSYMVDKQKGQAHNITSLDEINAYHDPNDFSLDYSPKHITEIVALLAAENVYYAINVLGYNEKLKQVLVQEFINERYGNYERRKELDSSPNLTIVRLNSGKILTMSKTQLNKDIDNIIRDDGYEIGYFDSTKTVNSSKEHHKL